MLLFYKLLRFIRFTICFSILLWLKLLKPLLQIQLVPIGAHKYGHLALEPDLMLMRLEDMKKQKLRRLPIQIRIWTLGPKRRRANLVLANLWKQQLFVVPSWLVNGLVQVGDKYKELSLEIIPTSIYAPANRHKSKCGPLLLSEKQNQIGLKGLLEMGIDPNRPYICLVVRDGGHLSNLTHPENQSYQFRNFDIDDFSEVTIALISRGYQVVRLGAGKEKPFSLKMDGLIDYATSSFRNELQDVYLAANCAFAVSTQTGPDAVCLLFRRPVCYVDIPLFRHAFLGSGLTAWNPVTYIRRGQKLSLTDISNSGVLWARTSEELQSIEIQVLRSSSSEIVEYVASYTDYFEAGLLQSPEDVQRSIEANQILENALGAKGRELFGGIEAIFNPEFLRRNSDWFLR